MPEVWVTMLSCSECLRYHDEDGSSNDCDCWCHDGDTDLAEDDDKYAELQAEHLAAADLDPNWPATYE